MSGFPRIVIVADDLTGAADSAAGVAARGLDVLLPISAFPTTPCDALVYSTESRDTSEEEAVRKVGELASSLGESDVLQHAELLYKKIDSTLRGHPEAELDILMEQSGRDRALVAPAFPAQGRTTLGGRLLVEGVPLAQTVFGRDSVSSDLVSRFRRVRRKVTLIGLQAVRNAGNHLGGSISAAGPGLLIGDAKTQDDLVRLARAAVKSGIDLFCGSAGLISACIEVLGWQGPGFRLEAADRPGRPGLVVAGSLHTRTREQVEFLERKGATVIQAGEARRAGNLDWPEAAKCAVGALESGQDVVLASPRESRRPVSRSYARRLAGVAKSIVKSFRPGCLVMTGGETAAAVCQCLEVSAIRIRGEITPGVPFGHLDGGLAPSMAMATKAGGFGDSSTLVEVLDFFRLRQRRTPM